MRSAVGPAVGAWRALALRLDFDPVGLVGIDFGLAFVVGGFGFFEDVDEVLALGDSVRQESDGSGLELEDLPLIPPCSICCRR